MALHCIAPLSHTHGAPGIRASTASVSEMPRLPKLPRWSKYPPLAPAPAAGAMGCSPRCAPGSGQHALEEAACNSEGAGSSRESPAATSLICTTSWSFAKPLASCPHRSQDLACAAGWNRSSHRCYTWAKLNQKRLRLGISSASTVTTRSDMSRSTGTPS